MILCPGQPNSSGFQGVRNSPEIDENTIMINLRYLPF
jgi:hypothetical protein